jgi:uncharacterized protein with PIN domain
MTKESIFRPAGMTAIDASAFWQGSPPGDCFAYASAKVHRVPLLFCGDDVSRTDIMRVASA